MSYIKLHNVSLEYPIYNSFTRSLRLNLFKTVGGKLADHNNSFTVQALKNINLNLNDRDRLAIIGHNGAGKSTLLRILSGIYKPTSGSLDIKGSISSLINIQLGMESEATGYENIIMRGIFMGMTFSQIKDKTEEIADFSELGPYLSLPMRTYSTGMAVRLAFAISTCIIPEILILDEMIGAGDSNFIKKAQQRTEQIMQEAKILILASHNTTILKEFCNKAILIKEGQIVAEGNINHVLKEHSKFAI
jgi:ABC-2 type transport system ATP-binding protein/lipopolysaccharide transport system ATP-binding protein